MHILPQSLNYKSPMAAAAKEIVTDLSPAIMVYNDGTVERLMGSPTVPPSPEDSATAVSSKDTSTTPHARLHLPNPTAPTQKLPIFVYFHGGAFCFESAFSSATHRYMNALSAAAKALVVSVEYRLVPEHRLPAAFEDSWAALKWVCSHALDHEDEETRFKKDEWISNHGDFDRIFIGGDSAGATIAHSMAMRFGSDPLPGNVKIAGAILSHPYFWGSNPIGNEPKEDIEEHFCSRLWLFCHPNAAGGIDNPMINPIADGAPSLSGFGCSKLLVCLAEMDIFTGRVIAYVENLQKSGWKGEVEVVVVEKEDHCFHIEDLEGEKAKNLIGRMASFISRQKDHNSSRNN